jgi:hypothetical protein
MPQLHVERVRVGRVELPLLAHSPKVFLLGLSALFAARCS